MYSKDHSFEASARESHSKSASSEFTEDADGDATSAAELEILTAALRDDAQRILRGLKRAWLIEWKRLGLRAIDAFFRGAFYVCLLGFGLTASIAASLLVVRGIRNAFHAWSGVEWAGDLGGGVVVLAVVIALGLGVRTHLRHELLRSAKRALLVTPDAPAKAGRS